MLDVLDESNSGLIAQKEFKDAIIKASTDNNVQLDDETLAEIVNKVYTSEDGSKAKQVSRQSIRKAME